MCEESMMVRIVKDIGKILLGIIVAIIVMGGFQSDIDEDSDYELTMIYDCRLVVIDRTNLYSLETKDECHKLLNDKTK